MSDTLEASVDVPAEPQTAAPNSGREGRSEASPKGARLRMESRKLNFSYGPKQALWDISLQIPEKTVTAFIGPSGCGKSTYLRCLNRMNDIIPDTRVEGEVLLDGSDIYGPGTDVVDLRRRVGMVFQKSNPFPKSIFDNVAYGLRINRLTKSREELGGRVESSLKSAALWDEVKDRLHTSAMSLSVLSSTASGALRFSIIHWRKRTIGQRVFVANLYRQDFLIPALTSQLTVVYNRNREAGELWGRTPGLDDPPWIFLDSRRMYRMDRYDVSREIPARADVEALAGLVNGEVAALREAA
jgi:hypothetical protein